MPIKATIDMHALGKRLKLARVVRDLTMQQLSALSGVGVAQICRLENGDKPGVQIDTLAALAGPLKVSLDHLVGLEARPVETATKRPHTRKATATPTDVELSLEAGYLAMAAENRQMAEEHLAVTTEVLS